MSMIHGSQLLPLAIHADVRGLLGVMPETDDLPFPLERIFFMKVDDSGVERGGHANSCDELIVALSGSVRVELDNGFERDAVTLADHASGLWIQPGVLIRLTSFEAGTILLVAASARYEDTRHFETPQPHLLQPHPLAPRPVLAEQQA